MTAFPGPDSSAPVPATDSTGLGTDTVAGTVSGDGTTGATWLDRYTDAVMNTFGTPGRVLVRGQGVHLWDADGKEYTDLLAGIAVNCLGHAHPAIVEAVTTQLSTLGHVSNFFTTPAQVRLAEELISLTLPGPTRARIPGLPGQLRDRGQRGRLQDRPPARRRQPPSRPGSPGRLPRTDHGRPGPDP